MVRRTRLERVNEGVTAEGGVRRGLGEKLVAFCEYGLVGHSILGRGLIETQRLFCFYGTQFFLQLGNLCLLPPNFFGCLSLMLHRQQPLFGLGQFVSLLAQFSQLSLVRGLSRRSAGSGSSSPWVSKVDGFNSSSRDDEAPLVELAVVLFFLVDILGFLLEPNTNGGRQLL
jgi:hypothetical protein